MNKTMRTFAPSQKSSAAAPASIAPQTLVKTAASAHRSRVNPGIRDTGYSFGRMTLRAEGPRDAHTRQPTQALLSAAAKGVSGSGHALPHCEVIQHSFGKHKLGSIRAHRDPFASAAARALGARAYTTGNRIAFTDSPDLRTVAHEAAHAIQQRAGLRPSGYLDRPGDALERHADSVADRVVARRSAQDLLDSLSAATAPSQFAVQRTPLKTDFGLFYAQQYYPMGPEANPYGLKLELHFDPDKTKVNARKIGLVQAAHTYLGGKDTAITPADKNRAVPNGEGKGYSIDQVEKAANPLYAAGAAVLKDGLADTATDPEYGQHGFHYKEGKETHHQEAILIDKPMSPDRSNNSGQQFETAALAVEGAQSGTYMGSVTWGWSVDGKGKFKKDDIAVKSSGAPSGVFKAAAKQWNQTKAGGTVRTNDAPTKLYDNSFKEIDSIPKGTEVKLGEHNQTSKDEIYVEVSGVKDSKDPKSPTTKFDGFMKVNSVDETGGSPVIQLPLP